MFVTSQKYVNNICDILSMQIKIFLSIQGHIEL